MTWILIVVGVGLVLGLAWFLLGRFIAKQMLFGKRNRCLGVERPEDRGFATERFWIPVDDQHHLHAWMIVPPDDVSTTPRPPCVVPLPCVVMVHGFSSHKDCQWTFKDEPDYRASMLDQGADSLCRAGFAVVAIDLRNHGQSDEHGFITLGQDEADDVLATLRYLHANSNSLGIDSDRIGLRGESMGAVTCLIATAKVHEQRQTQMRSPNTEVPDVRALWCDSPFADAHRVVGDFMAYAGIGRHFAPAARFWLNRITGRNVHCSSPKHYAHHIDCPVMIVHSEDDPMIGIDHFEELSELGWRSPPMLWRLTKHGHNRLWKEPGYLERQTEFFREYLMEATVQPAED